jgi:hypothetical protein
MLSLLLVFLFEFPIPPEFTRENQQARVEALETMAEPGTGKDNLAYRWGKVALIATANDTDKFRPRPTVTSRFLALVFTSMFDAWSRYDAKAIPVFLQDVDRRPVSEQTLTNKEIATSYAAYRSMSEYFFSDEPLFRKFMIELGLNPDNQSLDPCTPEGVGNLAAKAVIDYGHHDGSNQYGDEKSSNGKPFSDYTGYQPVNTADEMNDPIRWQPKYFSDGRGGKFAPPCLTPFWGKVKPIGLKSGNQFRPGLPPKLGSEQLLKEVKEVVDSQANLTDEQKALVEFMRDGPKSVQQAGHWLMFAQELSVKYNHSLDDDIKMYFYNQITAMDAFIACWDSKMYYDYARPFALVHEVYKDQKIFGWAGPGKGVIEMNGQEWRPYSPDVFLCPPFPSYVSGHSAVSGGCAEALKLFTGRDDFGFEVTVVAGALTNPDHPGQKVTLKFPTLTRTAEMAGISRVLGGYHIQSENRAGLELGRNVAHETWKFYNHHIGNTPKTTRLKN